jgi:hypothetical protein
MSDFEVPDPGWFDKLLSIVSKRDRHVVTVLVLLLGLGAGSFSAWAYANSTGGAFVDERIETHHAEKVQPILDDHEKRLEAVEKSEADMTQMKTDIAQIRQILTDRLPPRGR